MKYFEDNKDYILVGSNSFLINELNEHIGVYKLPKTDTEIRWTILFRNPFCHSTIMIRSDIIRNEGILYDEYLKTAQDFDFLYRIIKYGKSGNIEIPLVEYRVHPDQIENYIILSNKKRTIISHSHLVNIGFNMSEDEVKDSESGHMSSLQV
jgi:GT2 family glycosyltransferase